MISKNLKKRLYTSILLFFLILIIFRINFRETRKPILLRHHISQNSSRKTNHFEQIVFGEISTFRKSDNLKIMEKAGTENPENPFSIVLEDLNMRSISSKKHEVGTLGNLGYGINIFQKNIKSKFGNMGSISTRKHELEVWQVSIHGA